MPVIYGAGGSIGGAVARALANEGARVFLSGRHISSVRKIADEILLRGDNAEADEVDALSEGSINEYVQRVAEKAGSIDISFNAIGVDAVQNIPLAEMTFTEFNRPIGIAMQTQFLTSVAAAKIMMKQRSGVILSLTATPGGIGYPMVDGFEPACCAMEGLSRNLASELGPYGIRVVNIRSRGSPDSGVFVEALTGENADEARRVIREMEKDTMLKTLPLMQDIANVAVFLSSGMASKITGVTIDVTCGTTNGLNYKMLDRRV